MDPPDVARARVLEIGCEAAGNLIPFAVTHPLARTVGIDLSQVHIDQGRRRVRALGLDNVELMHGDVAHLDLAAVGQFDFMICHGVYSWVPDEVQDAILAAWGQLLSPPVWHTSATTRIPAGRPRKLCATRCSERRRQRDD